MLRRHSASIGPARTRTAHHSSAEARCFDTFDSKSLLAWPQKRRRPHRTRLGRTARPAASGAGHCLSVVQLQLDPLQHSQQQHAAPAIQGTAKVAAGDSCC